MALVAYGTEVKEYGGKKVDGGKGRRLTGEGETGLSGHGEAVQACKALASKKPSIGFPDTEAVKNAFKSLKPAETAETPSDPTPETVEAKFAALADEAGTVVQKRQEAEAEHGQAATDVATAEEDLQKKKKLLEEAVGVKSLAVSEEKAWEVLAKTSAEPEASAAPLEASDDESTGKGRQGRRS